MSRPELCVGAVVVHDGRLLLIRRGRGPGVGLWSVATALGPKSESW